MPCFGHLFRGDGSDFLRFSVGHYLCAKSETILEIDLHDKQFWLLLEYESSLTFSFQLSS